MKSIKDLECVIVKPEEFDKYHNDLALLLYKLGNEECQYITDTRISPVEFHEVTHEITREVIAEHRDCKWYMLYYAGEVPVAMIVGYPGHKGGAANLHYLYVDPEYRNQGLGTIMLDWFFDNLQQLSEATTIILGAMLNNTIVTKWYEKNGFKPYHVSMAAPIRKNK